MKKWLIRYLLLNFLAFSLPGSYTISIFKLGGLIAHFHQHEQHSVETTFFNFLTSHYFDNKHHEVDHSDHEDLPFHDHHSENVNIAAQNPFLPTVHPSTFDASKVIVQSDRLIAEVASCHSSSYLGDIWQPPKA